MAPIKEFDTLPASVEKHLPGNDPGRPQPIALEVPVTVNGARAIEGSTKREPFSETTQTVLVLGHGAVIRLASAVVSGQLLFLTNEKTKKEVVCQVVKSKNYRNVTGYVELEFTEAMPGFWGMRFPNDRAAQPVVPSAMPSAPGAVSGSPVSPKAAPIPPSRAASASERKSAPAPESHEVLTTDALKTPKPPANLTLPRTLEIKSAQPQSKISVPSEPSWTSSISRPPETKAPVSIAIKGDPGPIVPAAPAPSNNTESTRWSLPLSERLSALEQKLKTPLTSAASVGSLTKKSAAADLASKIFEIAKADVPHSKASPKQAVPVVSSLDVDEVKIPTWLEPLAHNATARSVQEERSAQPEIPEIAKIGVSEIEEVQPAKQGRHVETTSVPPLREGVSAAAADPKPIGSTVQRETSEETAPAPGNQGMMIGAIAAGILLLVVAGAWLLRRPAAQATTSAVPTSIAAFQSGAIPAGSQGAPSNPASVVPGSDATPQASVPAQTVRSVDKGYAAQELAAYKKLAEPEPKKPTIGEVHLASPTLSRRPVRADSSADSVPSIADAQTARDASGASLIATNNAQPAAPAIPLPIGGNVQAARLLSSVPPVYPALARTQRISGDVRVDALIDASGKVSAMKVISGPALLHQAAMDSLRQWKYRPATLNGSAVATHLAVTVQFHLQ